MGVRYCMGCKGVEGGIGWSVAGGCVRLRRPARTGFYFRGRPRCWGRGWACAVRGGLLGGLGGDGGACGGDSGEGRACEVVLSCTYEEGEACLIYGYRIVSLSRLLRCKRARYALGCVICSCLGHVVGGIMVGIAVTDENYDGGGDL